MITVRYPDPATAEQVAQKLAGEPQTASSPQVELVLTADADGRAHVSDPQHGARFMARSNVVSWGGFGLLFGAIAGAAGGRGILAILGGGIVTGLAWGCLALLLGFCTGPGPDKACRQGD